MKKQTLIGFLSGVVALLCLGWAVSDFSLNTNQFSTASQKVAIKTGVLLTNFVASGTNALGTNAQLVRVGGDARGHAAIDLQDVRSAANQVAEGAYSFIGPGAQNSRITVNGSMGVILSGLNNEVDAGNAIILYGGANTNRASGTVMWGGSNFDDSIGGNNLVGGTDNRLTGFNNDALAIGASNMRMTDSGDSAMLASIGSSLTGSRESTTLAGGSTHITDSIGSAAVGAGQSAMTNADHSFIAGGIGNKMWKATNAFIGGGSASHVSNSLNGFSIGATNRVAAHNAGAVGKILTNTTDNTIDIGVHNTSKATVSETALTVRSNLVLEALAVFPDNIRQTFNPGADAAGLNVGSFAGDPGTPSNGDLWYDSTANELTARINGANVALGAGSSGVSTNLDNVTITNRTEILTGPLVYGNDADRTTILGRARIDSRTSDNAVFSHFDKTATTDYALRQNAAGTTTLNGGVNELISFAIGGTSILQLGTNTQRKLAPAPGLNLAVDLGDNTTPLWWRSNFVGDAVVKSNLTVGTSATINGPQTNKDAIYIQQSGVSPSRIDIYETNSPGFSSAIQGPLNLTNNITTIFPTNPPPAGVSNLAVVATTTGATGVTNEWGYVAGGGSQTPWTSDINAGGFSLTNIYNIPYVIHRSGSTVTASNTTDETTIYTNTIPGAFLGTNKTAVLEMSGRMLNNTSGSSNFTVRAYIGTTKFYDDAGPAFGANANYSIWRMSIRISNRDTNNSQLAIIDFRAGARGSTTTGTGEGTVAIYQWVIEGEGLTTEDSTAALPFWVTIQPSTGGTLMFDRRHAMLKIE